MYLNLNRIGTWSGSLLSIGILAAGLLTGYSEVQGMKLATSEAMAVASSALAVAVEERTRNEQRDAILTRLSEQVGNIYRRGLIVQGKALVMETGDEPYVELNGRDPNGPSRLSEFEHLNITNLTHPDLILAKDVAIGPTFSNATQGYVMNISRAAGELLHASPGAWIEVRAVPVYEDK